MVTSTEIIVLSANNGNIPSSSVSLILRLKLLFNAYVLQGVLSVLLAMVFSDGLIILYTFPTWIFLHFLRYCPSQMRFTELDLERPYWVWSLPDFILDCMCHF